MGSSGQIKQELLFFFLWSSRFCFLSVDVRLRELLFFFFYTVHHLLVLLLFGSLQLSFSLLTVVCNIRKYQKGREEKKKKARLFREQYTFHLFLFPLLAHCWRPLFSHVLSLHLHVCWPFFFGPFLVAHIVPNFFSLTNMSFPYTYADRRDLLQLKKKKKRRQKGDLEPQRRAPRFQREESHFLFILDFAS